MNRREFLVASAAFLGASPFNSRRAFRVAFGSCALQTEPQPVWRAIADHKPDLFIFLGDNVYGDSDKVDHLARQYEILGRRPEFAEARRQFPMVATWDDHDYGRNDSGAEFPIKEESKKLFLRFFAEPAFSERWQRPGVYTSYSLFRHGLRLQIILLDLRWFRTPLNIDGEGRYGPEPDPAATLLGLEQWNWLEKELQRPADLRLIGSSIQVLSPEHRYEKWANYPRDKARLFNLFDRLNINNAIFLSGDMHYGELSKDRTPGGRELIDFTSSGLNRFESASPYQNSKRVYVYDQSANFGLVTMGTQGDVHLELKNERGLTMFDHWIGRNTLATAN